MNKRFFFVGLLSLMLLSAYQHSAHHHHYDDALTEEHAHEDSRTGQYHHSEAIVLAPEKARAAEVQVSIVKPGDFYGIQTTGGKIMSASSDETTLVATITGVISWKRPVTEGIPVNKGSEIFTIVSSGLQDGDISKRANIACQTAKAEYETAALAYRAIGQNNGTNGVKTILFPQKRNCRFI